MNAKYVLERAASIQAENNEMSFSISLLLMHDALELLMLGVLDHLQLASKPKREFMTFWAEIKQAGLPEPPDFIPMESLNKLRVGLKHNGNLPNPQTVLDLLPRARGFFENILRAHCQITYEDVSLIDLVPDEGVRVLLKEARLKFLNGDRVQALTDLKIALHKLENPEGKHLPRMSAPRKPSLPNEMERAGWGAYLGQLHSFLEQCASRTNALMYGVDPIRYVAFVQAGPSVQWSMAGTPIVTSWSTYEDLSIERFDELVSFLIDYALKISEAYIPISVRRVHGTTA